MKAAAMNHNAVRNSSQAIQMNQNEAGRAMQVNAQATGSTKGSRAEPRRGGGGMGFASGRTRWIAAAMVGGLALMLGLASAAQAAVTAGLTGPVAQVTGGGLTRPVKNAVISVSLTSPADNTILTAPATFNLAASASSKRGRLGTIAKVEFYSGSTLLGTATAAPWTHTWSNVPYGTYSITAKATDDLGFSNTSAPVTVISNQPPSVSVTSPANNTVSIAPAAFTLTADASDVDGAIAKVEFYANGALIGTAAAAPYTYTWSNVAAGAYSVTAVATDNHGAATTSAAVSITSNAPPTVSIASPGNNAVVAAPGSFALTANAADSDGTIAKVDYYANGALIGSATAAPYSYTWSNVAAGTYSLTAVATDNYGAATTSSAVAVISDTPPAVNLTGPAADTVSTAPGSFTLTASASSSMSTIAKVEFYNGATLLGTATAAPYSYTWNNVPAGSYSLTAVATDGYGISNTSAAVAVISNAAPAVGLTSPAANSVVTAPGSFTLTANAADTDGTIAKVEFYNGATLIGTATAAPYSHTWNNVAAGSYSITAVATDNHGASTTSAAVAVISNQAPTVSLVSPLANAVSVAPGSFTLTANATDTDGTIAKVEFYNGTTLIGTATAAPYSYTWSNVPAGTYSLTAVATDNLGAQTTSAAVSVISDALPTVRLTSPNANAVSVAPGSFTLSADTGSITSTIAKVEFYAKDSATNTSTLIGTATAAPYAFNWSNVPAGSYTLTAVATDALGITATSAAVTVTSDQAPTVTLTSPAAGAQITSPNSYLLTATASSVTSTIAKVEFYAKDGATNTNTLIGTATSAPYGITWTNVPVGNFTLTAVATDALGIATTSSGISVSAIANVPPAVSLTSPANGATAVAPANLTLTANATSTTSTVSKVDFYANDGTSNTLVGTATNAPYSVTWANVALGSYSITAVATDTLNASTTSSAVSVTVNTGVAQAYYIHADHLDTPRQITDTAGNIVWQWDNTDPFGNNVPNENPNGAGQFNFNLRFPGQYADKETNTYYNVNRDYDPAMGRYIESDPIGLWGGINTYTYVNGNPLSYVDPFGLYYCAEGAVCNFTDRMDKALKCFDKQTKRNTKITSGCDSHKKTDPHMRGEAIDIGSNANPDLSRSSAEIAFLQCFYQGEGG